MKVNGQINATAALRRGNSPQYAWVGGWLTSRDDLGIMEKQETFCSSQEMNPDSSIIELVT
jgi:hypothetical protein